MSSRLSCYLSKQRLYLIISRAISPLFAPEGRGDCRSMALLFPKRRRHSHRLQNRRDGGGSVRLNWDDSDLPPAGVTRPMVDGLQSTPPRMLWRVAVSGRQPRPPKIPAVFLMSEMISKRYLSLVPHQVFSIASQVASAWSKDLNGEPMILIATTALVKRTP
jgi:hypothetical protein